MVLLSIVLTRSSVASLQAKAGLPFGNQVVGWLLMGKKPNLDITANSIKFMSDNVQFFRSRFLLLTGSIQMIITFTD